MLKMGIDRNSEPHHPIGQSTSFSPPSPPINTQTTTLPQKKEQIAKLCTLDSPFIKQEQKKTAPKNPGAPGAPQGHFECERQYLQPNPHLSQPRKIQFLRTFGVGPFFFFFGSNQRERYFSMEHGRWKVARRSLHQLPQPPPETFDDDNPQPPKINWSP